jgi:hypothetical protein
MKRASLLKSNGSYYGYPPCCIAEFIEGVRVRDAAQTPAEYSKISKARLRRHRGKPWEGSGFLPCKKCALTAARNYAKFIDENITPRRKHAEPFKKPKPRSNVKASAKG